MPTYTFSRGNALGVRRIPLYLLGALATLIVPRTDRVWVFGSGIGPGEGALPLLRLAGRQLGPGVRLVWLATTERELRTARSLGLDSVLKLSLQGFWLTMRARVLVVTHGQGDVNRYGARGGFLVQLWHGIPLKRLHLHSPVVTDSSLLGSRRLGRAVIRRGLRAVGRQISLFPVASAVVADRMTGAFGVRPEHVVVTGDPRDDVLLQGEPEQRRATARAALIGALGPIPDTSPVVMYAPTWREGDPDPAAPSDEMWQTIADWLAEVEAVLIVRSHPLGHGDYARGPAVSDRVRLLDSTMIADLTPLLPGVDHLVTDYSSAAYDFALTGGSTVFLTADVLSYTATRGLYEPYECFSGGCDVAGWDGALLRLDELVRRVPEAIEVAEAQRSRLVSEHFDQLDGAATDRVFAEILRRTSQGEREPERRRSRVEAVSATLDGRTLRLVLDLRGAALHGAWLDGPRERVEAVLTPDGSDTERVCAQFPLLVDRWGSTGLALPSGDYHVVLATGPNGHSRPVLHGARVSESFTSGLFRAEVAPGPGGLNLRIEAPLTDAERTPAGQRALRLASFTARGSCERAVYLESFYGRSACDNPAAIDRILARRFPDVTRYWSVADRSMPVPDGAVPLVEFSSEWWRVRADARLLVINDWLRWAHRPRRGQKVLQTWHGTMLKKLALDRSERSRRQRVATRVQSRRWDALLAQNAYSAGRLRSSYDYRGPIWTLGYPRNDLLQDTDRAALVRSWLDLPADARVVLYVPTWRDDRDELVDHLDFAGFARQLPGDTVLLVRGHSRTLPHGRSVEAARLVDVTTYPDITDLLLVADVLVTDYSSVMFDFAVTGKPMVFFTPDISHYAEVLRGFYFDLATIAPGPVVGTMSELLDAVVHSAKHADEFAERYSAWRERFVPLDDGGAAERVVDRMVAQGWLD